MSTIRQTMTPAPAQLSQARAAFFKTVAAADPVARTAPAAAAPTTAAPGARQGAEPLKHSPDQPLRPGSLLDIRV